MYKKWIALSLLLAMLLSGCGKTKDTSTSKEIPITLTQHIPAAYVDNSYDLSALVVKEEGIDYQFSASYADPETGKSKELKVKKEKITPKAEADICVTVTATQGEKSSSMDFVVPIHVSADALEQFLTSDGIAGEADAGVSKTITKDTAYIQGEASTSALAVSFSNPTQTNVGTSLMTLSHYALHPYYSAQVWRNAAVTFWVYNPMAQDVQFKLSSYNSETEKSLLWDSAENTQTQVAKADQWTQVTFSLYDMGIQTPLSNAAEYQTDDYLKVLARYNGNETCNLYIDNIDIVHADTLEDISNSYSEIPVPQGNYSDLLKTGKVYTLDTVAKLSSAGKGNNSSDSYCFGSNEAIGNPTFYVDFPSVTDISGLDYLKFDILAEDAYPYVTVAIRYLDKNGDIKHHGTGYDYYANNEWQTIYLNLEYLNQADLTQVVGICFSVHMDTRFVAGKFNCVYFDNVCLYDFPNDEPQMSPAAQTDNDIISGPFYTRNVKPNTNGVCQVATDEKGSTRTNSILCFWTNNACGYPNVDATFLLDAPQNWSEKSILSFDTHQSSGHYWLQFDILYLDKNGNQRTAWWRYDTVLTAWQTNHASLDWFKTEDGENIKLSDLNQVVGFRVAANMAINVTGEVAMIYFDNFVLS